SEGNVALTRVGVASVEANIELARNQLADLAGAGPDRGQRLERPRLAPPAGIALPSALPADLLARRPDVAAARARVEAAGSGLAVADVVANWRALERESTEQQIALEAAQRSYDLTSERYRAGLDNYLSVLASQNQVIQAQGLRAQLRSRRLTFSVDLVRALGG